MQAAATLGDCKLRCLYKWLFGRMVQSDSWLHHKNAVMAGKEIPSITNRIILAFIVFGFGRTRKQKPTCTDISSFIP